MPAYQCTTGQVQVVQFCCMLTSLTILWSVWHGATDSWSFRESVPVLNPPKAAQSTHIIVNNMFNLRQCVENYHYFQTRIFQLLTNGQKLHFEFYCTFFQEPIMHTCIIWYENWSFRYLEPLLTKVVGLSLDKQPKHLLSVYHTQDLCGMCLCILQYVI